MTQIFAMVDIESFGLKPGSAVASIGAVVADMDAPIGSMPESIRYYQTINMGSSLDLGLAIEGSCMEWWTQENLPAFVEVLKKTIPARQAIWNFTSWYKMHVPRDTPIYCHGLNFDIPLLDVLFEKAETAVPWKYNSTRDDRTIFDLAGLDFKNSGIERKGLFHNALDDAVFQASCVQKAWKMLKHGLPPMQLPYNIDQGAQVLQNRKHRDTPIADNPEVGINYMTPQKLSEI